MCGTCNGEKVVLKSLGFGVMFAPCPECNSRRVADGDDNHPGQRMEVFADPEPLERLA